jgi:hypothetical protein
MTSMATQANVPQAVPQSKLAVVTTISKPAPETITQLTLTEVIVFRTKIEQYEEQLAALEKDIRARLEAGAAVEPGLRFATLQEHFRRNVSWREVSARLAERLYGENQGEGYCQRVLSSTKPTRNVSLEIR